MTKNEKFNKYFNAFILIGMTVSMVLMTIYKLRTAESDSAMVLFAAFGSLMGVLSTVCSANAKILTFLFGFFDVAIYGFMCFYGQKYGNGALHLLYFLPMQFIGFWQWRKRGATAKAEPKARRFSSRQWLLYGALFLAGLIVAYIVLANVASDTTLSVIKIAILMDAFSMMCNILGQMLMSMAFMEQWIFWIGVNVSTVIMWSITLSQDSSSDYALIYVIKYVFYLINSFNGLRIWLQLSRPGDGANLDN